MDAYSPLRSVFIPFSLALFIALSLPSFAWNSTQLNSLSLVACLVCCSRPTFQKLFSKVHLGRQWTSCCTIECRDVFLLQAVYCCRAPGTRVVEAGTMLTHLHLSVWALERRAPFWPLKLQLRIVVLDCSGGEHVNSGPDSRRVDTEEQAAICLRRCGMTHDIGSHVCATSPRCDVVGLLLVARYRASI